MEYFTTLSDDDLAICCIGTYVRAGRRSPFPARKRYILLEGAGSSSRTGISFNAHTRAGIDQIMRRPNVSLDDELLPTFRSATFTVLADNFVARGISFKVLLVRSQASTWRDHA